jgi:hypothetical protein
LQWSAGQYSLPQRWRNFVTGESDQTPVNGHGRGINKHGLGYTNRKLGQFSEAIAYHKKAIDLMEDKKTPAGTWQPGQQIALLQSKPIKPGAGAGFK